MENNIPPQRCFIHKGRFFFCDTGSMQTVRLTLWLDDWGPVLWYISTVLLYIGSPRSRPVWIQADLAHNSYQWSSVLNIFKGSTTSSKWWGYHARVPPISQVTTNLSWQTRPSQIPPWIRSHRSLRIILSIMDTHMISGVHLMSILMTMRQISSPMYFPPAKIKMFLSKNVCTISFRRTHRRRMLHGVWTKEMMVCTTPQSDNGYRTIRTTICWSLSCGHSKYLYIFIFYILTIVMPTWYIFVLYLYLSWT